MKAGKVPRPNGKTSELLKVCKNNSVKKWAEVSDELLQGKKMSESWRTSNLKPIYNGKDVNHVEVTEELCFWSMASK